MKLTDAEYKVQIKDALERIAKMQLFFEQMEKIHFNFGKPFQPEKLEDAVYGEICE